MNKNSPEGLVTSLKNEPDDAKSNELLFRPGVTYKIIETIVPGNPIVLLPRECQETAQSLVDHGSPVQLLPLIGTRRRYEDILVLEIEKLDGDAKTPREQTVGFLQAVRMDNPSLQELPVPSDAKPEDIMLRIHQDGGTAGYVLGRNGEQIKAGIIVYSTEPEEQPNVEQTPPKIEITMDDLRERQVPFVVLPLETVESASPLPSPDPVPCAYRGKHCITQPVEFCRSCGVAVCRECRKEVQGCVNVECPDSICR